MKNKTEEFIKKALEVHGNKYDYSKALYKGYKEKIEIICPAHGSFFQTPNGHLVGKGCPLCGIEKQSGGIVEKHKKAFIEKARKVHGDKYDYSKVDYKGCGIQVEIICKKHGSFFQTPSRHLGGKGCLKCERENRPRIPSKNLKIRNKTTKTLEKFKEDAKAIHGDKYDYSKTIYTNAKTPVEIICKLHGSFFQTPHAHLAGKGCQKCKSSHGESSIRRILKEHNISFEEQKKFKDCRDKLPLPFDFYIPSKNIAIEYNGEQHYKIFNHFGGRKKFLNQKHHDWLKRKYCKSNNICLITIRYDDEQKIENRLEPLFK